MQLSEHRESIHFRSIRARNNAGIDIPECVAAESPLDLDRGSESMSGQVDDVTCLACKRSILRDPWHLSVETLRSWEADLSNHNGPEEV